MGKPSQLKIEIWEKPNKLENRHFMDCSQINLDTIDALICYDQKGIMKIDILGPLPDNIFKNKGKYTLIFIGLLALFCFGLAIMIYAWVSETKYYERLEKVVLFFFIVPPLLIAYFGGKLQAYQKLTPIQVEEFNSLCEKHSEIKSYYDKVLASKRELIRAEYEACLEWDGKNREVQS